MNTAEIFRDYHPDRKGIEPLPGNVAFVFPGQGTQHVGMIRDLMKISPAAQQVIKEADSTLNFSLSGLIFEGPEQELLKTSNAQPAILTASIACLRALQETKELKPAFVAGHSVGQITAMVAAGALTLADGINLTRQRGLAMQQAAKSNPGGMMAVLDFDEAIIEEVCQETGAQIANVNTPTQIVISGNHLELANAGDLLTHRGAKILPLKVAGAFHSKHMKPAVQRFSRALNQISFKDADVPVIDNVSARPLTLAEDLRKALGTQLVEGVRWNQSVNFMLKEGGINMIIEFGPGSVLTGFLKRTAPDIKRFNVNSTQSLQAINS